MRENKEIEASKEEEDECINECEEDLNSLQKQVSRRQNISPVCNFTRADWCINLVNFKKRLVTVDLYQPMFAFANVCPISLPTIYLALKNITRLGAGLWPVLIKHWPCLYHNI